MRRIIVLSMISLDGVMQAPGGRKEDESEGFEYGGWTAPFGDEVIAKALEVELKQTDYLLGRKTFDIWEAYWPQHGDFWPAINAGNKYVLSRTRHTSGWEHSAFLQDVSDIQELKKTDGPDIQVWGSSEVVHLLLKHDLVDELRLKIYPILLGKGKKLFDNEASSGSFALTDSHVTTTGVILAHYKRDGEVKTKDVTI